MGRIPLVEGLIEERGGMLPLGRKAAFEEKKELQALGRFSFAFFMLYFCLVLCVSTAFGFSHPSGELHPPLPSPFVPFRPRPFFISLREISFLLCLGAVLVPLFSPRFASRVRISIKRKAPVVTLLGCSLLIPFFVIPPFYKPFALGVMFIPAILGLSGFFSALGERFANLLKLSGVSEVLLVVLGALPFLIFLSLVVDRFYFRFFFNLLMIYGLGGVISLLI